VAGRLVQTPRFAAAGCGAKYRLPRLAAAWDVGVEDDGFQTAFAGFNPSLLSILEFWMTPRMSGAELSLFSSFLRCSDNYFEFGAGGSTCLAAGLVKTSVTSIDSSQQWLDDVANYCATTNQPIKPELIYADIGPTYSWGFPAGESQRRKWPAYHEGCWVNPRASDADLYLVDGRFRVACFMQTVLHCRPDSLILIHDFASRDYYQVVREVAREIAKAGDLSVFQPLQANVRSRAREILEAHQFDIK